MFRNPLIAGVLTALALAAGFLICDWLTQHPHAPRVSVAVVFVCVFGLLRGLGVYWFMEKDETRQQPEA